METTAVMGCLALVVLILVRDVIVPMTKKGEANGKNDGKIGCPMERDLIEYRMAMKLHESELRRIADGLTEISREMREVVNLLRREVA